MRLIQHILDLPWWGGFIVFLIGNLLIPFSLIGYIFGLVICLMGCWTFSKLLKPNEYAEAGQAIICIPLMIASLWFFNDNFIAWSYSTLYVIRLIAGLFFGFLGFQGFRK